MHVLRQLSTPSQVPSLADSCELIAASSFPRADHIKQLPARRLPFAVSLEVAFAFVLLCFCVATTADFEFVGIHLHGRVYLASRVHMGGA